MRRFNLVVAVLAAAAIAASAAVAANAHWVSGPSATVSGNSLIVTGKAAGLGSTSGSTTDFSLTGSVNVSSRCFTKSNNTPQAGNKQETITVNQSGTFPIRNGSVTPTFTVTPLSTLTCPKGQVVRIQAISYDLFLNSASFPSLNTELTG